MINHLQKMLDNLSENDKQMLKDIWEPRVVAVPPQNSCEEHLCVTEDGEIRFYGYTKFNGKEQRCYIASRDCGLSWKTYIENDGNALGTSYKIPYCDKYVSYIEKGKSHQPLVNFDENGSLYAAVSDTGCGSTNYELNKISSDNEFRNAHNGIALKHRQRIILLSDYGIYDGDKCDVTAALAYSDDCGKTWTTVKMPRIPKPDVKEPHKGPRWYNAGCEPTITELDDGTLLMIVRTSHNYHYYTNSYDGGETWTEYKPTKFHSTLTMPKLLKLSDGRIMFFWCNTQPLPELDHTKQHPILDPTEIDGTWEDVFTNRDANHCAISEDGGKTWIGFREIALNCIRNECDFRSKGGRAGSNDKSIHQPDPIELPFGKILLAFGQHVHSRKLVIFDIGWLYETSRSDNFGKGLDNLSTQVYVKSVSGMQRDAERYAGHCAWNRTNGALLMPDPDDIFEEALLIKSTNNPCLFSNLQGAVWNYPASSKGEVTVKLRVCGKGIRISLTDRWFNPIDTEIANDAQISFIYNKKSENWVNIKIVWNTDENNVMIFEDDKKLCDTDITKEAPFGLSYLHLQSLEDDFDGTYIKMLNKSILNKEFIMFKKQTKEQSSIIKVACVGDSITYGAGVSDPAVTSYPAVLQKRLGNGFEVKNFGVSSTSALKSAEKPYTDTEKYTLSLEFKPDVVALMLGTNDIKNENWIEGSINFKKDYTDIIESYKKVNPNVKIIVGFPPKIFKENVFGRSPKTLGNEAIPIIREIADEFKLQSFDIFNLMKDMGDLFPDFLHPNDEGSAIIADAVADKIIETVTLCPL